MNRVAQWRPAILFLALSLLASPGFAGSREAHPVTAAVFKVLGSVWNAVERIVPPFGDGSQLDPNGGGAPSDPGTESNGESPPPDPDRGAGLDPWG